MLLGLACLRSYQHQKISGDAFEERKHVQTVVLCSAGVQNTVLYPVEPMPGLARHERESWNCPESSSRG